MAKPIIPYHPKLKSLSRDLRKNMTVGEKILWQHLRRRQMMGFAFLRQRPIDEFIVDFYCKDLMLAIEVDGSSHDSEDAQLRDQIRQTTLESFGVRFLRFSEDDVRRNTAMVLEKIADWIQKNSHD